MLDRLENKVSQLRNEAEICPSCHNNVKLKEATAKLRYESQKSKKEAWREKTEGLNMDREGRKLWKLVKSLSGDTNINHPLIVERNGNLISGKAAGDILIKHMCKSGEINISHEKEKQTMKEVKETLRAANSKENELDQPFTMQELNNAINLLKLKSSPGVDGILNEFLINLGLPTKKRLLKLFNTSWKIGKVPETWKEGVIIPILKEGKTKTDPNNFRPITLLSCMGKLMERLVNNRLIWLLESKDQIIPEQAGFRRFRSTEDQIAYIAQAIEDGFQKQEHTLAVWVDLEKAFDKVWTEGLILKAAKMGINGKALIWLNDYLRDRKARVNLRNVRSRARYFANGVPQGGVLSPVLFLIYINDILQNIPNNVKASLFADDIAIWSKSTSIQAARYRMQMALNSLCQWTEEWAMTVNLAKTKYPIFSLSTKMPESLNLKFNQQELTKDENPTSLGIKFD